MRGLILIIVAATGGMAAMAWASQPSLNESERMLFERLARVTANGPPTPAAIARTFGLPAPCGRENCAFDLPGADAGFASGDLRAWDQGLIFVLERPRGQCVRIDRAAARFRLGPPVQACFDAECWYREDEHDWGFVAFGVDTPDAVCASSVVINRPGHSRPRRAR